ncbi:3'-5' exonuclease [Acholeplasma granularum]|uniref:3'-5' exonuclease n=1 Tax=Acholeplasma granularum TaxID=264635 RepID=UPI000470CB58|nr:3'-5' exonuclease [Acholeplasma granularum]
MILDYKEILVFDFETTGLYPKRDKVIEIGAVLLEKKDDTYIIKEEVNLLIKQDKPITDFISNLTGITNEMLEKDGIDEESAFRKLDSMISEDTLLVAYNLAFDIGFLSALYQMYVNPRHLIKNDILDCMAVYKDRYPYPHKLESAVTTFNLINQNAHRASEDAKATFEVLKMLANEQNNLKIYVNVLGYNKKYGLPNREYFFNNIKLVAQGFNGYREIEKEQIKNTY